MMTLKRRLVLPPAGEETFFLWGPRQSGKSTLLRETYPGVLRLDLLKAEVFRRYGTRPELLREELEASPSDFVVIDEVQKVPALLDEVHWLHENRGVRFALCGSSARKLKRGGGNLLGGRAVRRDLFGLSAMELGGGFDLTRVLNHGTLPRHYLSEAPGRLLDAYVSQYLQEEIMAEGLVRRLPPFAGFLRAAALTDTEQVNFSNIARELAVSRETVRGFFEILIDTLIARMLPPFRLRPKRRIEMAQKFYFADVGVVNWLARRGRIEAGSELFGKALENWVFHELSCYNSYSGTLADFSYWRLSTGVEVDFIVNDLECAIEVKSSETLHDRHLHGLRELKKDHPKVKRRVVVCRETSARRTSDGIDIFPVPTFLDKLWSGELF